VTVSNFVVQIIRVLTIASIAPIALAITAPPVSACDCHGGGLICEDFWRTPVVFAGRVDSVTPIGERGSSGPHERVRFRVLESFRGTAAGDIDIFNWLNNCHFRFTPHEEWIIYAFPGKDGVGLTTSFCTRSALLEAADEDVAYARAALTRSAEKGRIIGQLTYAHQAGDIPVPGIRITLFGAGSPSITVVTDAQGRYKMRTPAGHYRLAAALPAGMTIHPRALDVELPDSRGCVVANLYANYPGQLAGRVRRASGEAVPNLTVELIDGEHWDYAPSRKRGITDASGRYSITGIRPGSYMPAVVIGYAANDVDVMPRYQFADGHTVKDAARRETVAGGTERAATDLILPDSVRVNQVEGVVVHVDGRPAAGVAVRMKATAGGSFPWNTIRTGARGAFSFALVVGMQYRLVAEPEDATPPSARRQGEMTIDPSHAIARLRLVVY
jgi:hypothetical protein